ncbi:hypothetical protein Patl1_01330 [Pistacia atlantica]|uniref:Uncharacterized protein n=1 Tax=Pistacia atlantica TaxID=434234 RepID=A0ACC1C9D3_9ROSI|nr:hypothetical protein Patl1_01330 [Pistacia atlantica]
MDPEAFTASLFKWDPRGVVPPQTRVLEPVGATTGSDFRGHRLLGGASKGARWAGGVVPGLWDKIFRWELLVGERYGIKAAVRAERRRLDEEDSRRRHILSGDTTNSVDALSQEGWYGYPERLSFISSFLDYVVLRLLPIAQVWLSEEPVQQEKEAAGSGGGGTWDLAVAVTERKKQRRRKGQRKIVDVNHYDENEDDENGEGSERQREHPFIVTEPGEVARGKKNGLDYLFHLYEQCRDFLIQVQNIAKERGEKCPTKVTNQVFRYAKKAGASYINKPKMRHYVHCYALHCLDEEASDALRRVFKERGENVGAWRQACYKPLVGIAARQGWDIDAIFNAHPRLAIWYVPTKLRQLCHAERNSVAASSSVSGGADQLPF